MKLSINSKELLIACQLVGACVKPKNTMPILDNLMFVLNNNNLTITADNLEIRSQVELNVEFKGELNTCISYKLLTDILKNLPNIGIELVFDNNKVTIDYLSGEYNIPLVSSKEFPTPKELKEPQSIKINSLDFSEALKKAVVFTETDTLSNQNNVLIKITEESIKVASVYDVAVIYEYSLDSKGSPSEILLSRDTVRYLTQTITSEEEVEISYTETHLHIKLEDRLITAIQSQGKFANYSIILNSIKTDKSVIVEKDTISSAIRRLCTITDQNSYTIVLSLSKNELELSLNNSFFHYEAKEVIQCEYEGDNVRIGFNAKYLMNMISTLDDSIKMELSESNRPCMFLAENIKALIAPMAI